MILRPRKIPRNFSCEGIFGQFVAPSGFFKARLGVVQLARLPRERGWGVAVRFVFGVHCAGKCREPLARFWAAKCFFVLKRQFSAGRHTQFLSLGPRAQKLTSSTPITTVSIKASGPASFHSRESACNLRHSLGETDTNPNRHDPTQSGA
jgi:hypothetical protein